MSPGLITNIIYSKFFLMILVNYIPNLGMRLAKALVALAFTMLQQHYTCSRELWKCPGNQLSAMDLSDLITGSHDFPVLFLDVRLSLFFVFLDNFSSSSFNALFCYIF